MTDQELPHAIEIIPDRLYWVALDMPPEDSSTSHYFCVDNEFVYKPRSALDLDFGPLKLTHTYRYCKLLDSKLRDPALAGKKVVHYCSHHVHKRANAAYLIAAYQVIVNLKTAEQACKPFYGIDPPFLPFRDATSNVCSGDLAIVDCLSGLQRAIELGWFNFKSFDVESYELVEKLEHPDMNWIVPEKLLAFEGPSATETDDDGFPADTPEDYLPFFRQASIGLVIRLNRKHEGSAIKHYDRRRFTDHGLRHVDLFFKDGSCPPPSTISNFLHIVENEPGAVAIHCKAGLGRTGCVIGLYCMKHFAFPARGFIAWNRMCRPGSICGPQHEFLVDMQNEMFQAGAAYKLANQLRLGGHDAQEKEFQESRQGMGIQDHRRLSEAQAKEDKGQHEGLVETPASVMERKRYRFQKCLVDKMKDKGMNMDELKSVSDKLKDMDMDKRKLVADKLGMDMDTMDLMFKLDQKILHDMNIQDMAVSSEQDRTSKYIPKAVSAPASPRQPDFTPKKWKVVAPSTLVVHLNVDLESQIVESLVHGAIVEQVAPSVTLSSGIVRCQITHPSSPMFPQPIGWVTQDATAAGGSIYLEPVLEPAFVQGTPAHVPPICSAFVSQASSAKKREANLPESNLAKKQKTNASTSTSSHERHGCLPLSRVQFLKAEAVAAEKEALKAMQELKEASEREEKAHLAWEKGEQEARLMAFLPFLRDQGQDKGKGIDVGIKSDVARDNRAANEVPPSASRWQPFQDLKNRKGAAEVGLMGMGGGRPGGGQQFPAALQKWLHKLFSMHFEQSDGEKIDQKKTHAYLRLWVQQWVKTGELWQKDWDNVPLPTAEEINKNLAPGSLSGAAGEGDNLMNQPKGGLAMAKTPGLEIQAAQAAELQQAQVTQMLKALSPVQRTQVQQAVDQYRTSLGGKGFEDTIVKTYVWNYYVQCVQSCYSLQKPGGEGKVDDAADVERQDEANRALVKNVQPADARREEQEKAAMEFIQDMAEKGKGIGEAAEAFQAIILRKGKDKTPEENEEALRNATMAFASCMMKAAHTSGA